jgi:hypothetical protein
MVTPVDPTDLSQVFSKAPVSEALRRRLNATVQRLGSNPESSLPRALGVAGYKGLMRALKNPRVEPSILLGAVYERTLERIIPGEDVLCIEDTTDLTFGGARGRKDLPRLEGKSTGFRAHVALAVRADGVHSVLGVLDLRQVVRGVETKASFSALERYEDPNKESLRWSQTVEATEVRVAGGASLIHVRDREGDDYEQLATMAGKGQRFVQRMRQARLIAEAPVETPAARKVDEAFDGVAGMCEREVTLSARAQSKTDPRPPADRKVHPARRRRDARLRFNARALTLSRPKNASKELPATLPINVVHVVEFDPPEGEQPVEWYLLTREPIDTVEQVLRVVDIYRARWLIEEFNKALQTGCQYEKLQNETAERLWTMLAFYAPIATNLLALRTLAHHDSERPASEALSPEEIAILEANRPTRGKNAQAPMTVKFALATIARMGGHFTSNGEPGWIVLLRGAVELHQQVRGWRMAMQHAARVSDAPD